MLLLRIGRWHWTMNLMLKAAAVTSSMALATTVCIEGTVASEIGTLEKKGDVLIHHPTGIQPVMCYAHLSSERCAL